MKKIDLAQHDEPALRAAAPPMKVMLEAVYEPFEQAWWAVRKIKLGLAALKDGVTEEEVAIPDAIVGHAREVAAGLAACRKAWKTDNVPPAGLPPGLAMPGPRPAPLPGGTPDAPALAAFETAVGAFVAAVEPFVDASDAVLFELVEVRGRFEVDLARIAEELGKPKAERLFAKRGVKGSAR